MLSRLLTGGSRWPRRFLAAAASTVGARVRTLGDAPRPGTLLICNHVSWLDILVMSSATGCRFVSKDQLGPGIMHWLADQNATLYIRRSHRKGSRDQALAIADALRGTQPVTLFPEGTTGPGDHLLPFRSTLLEAAALAGPEVEVRPAAIDYGAAGTEVGWHGESGIDNALRLLGRRTAMPVVVHLLDPLDRRLDRKAMAHQARESIAAALAASSSPAAGL